MENLKFADQRRHLKTERPQLSIAAISNGSLFEN